MVRGFKLQHQFLGRIGPGCVLGLALLLFAACDSTETGHSSVVAPASRGAGVGTKAWGLYQILWNERQFTAELDDNLALLGGTPHYVLFFRDLHAGRGFPSAIAAVCQQRELTPVVSLELSVWGRGGQGRLQAIVEGDYDAFFRRWGADAAAWGEPVLLRFGFEMNGDWFPWGQQPELFKRAWRHAHAEVLAGGGTNVRWVFSPNVLYGDLTAESGIAVYYPGDEVVDMVALDGYNFGDHHDEWHAWQSFTEVFGPSLDALARYRKPLILAEVGCADDPRKAAWLRDCLQQVEADARIRGLIFFHFDKRREGEPNWRLDSDGDSLQAFRAWAGPAP